MSMTSKTERHKSTPIISTDKLCKTFSTGGAQQHVLKNLDLEIMAGDFTVIMGASGSGKSTLLYALSGMDTPSLGRIEFCGEQISSYSSDQLAVFRKDHCGFVFQQVHLIDTMSCMDNVLAAALLQTNDKQMMKQRAMKLFTQMGMDESDTTKFPGQLSGGEAQRVGLARAVISNPEVLFADEPTGALNSNFGAAVLDILTQMHERGQSIVMVTHDITSALRGNRIIYLKDGSIQGECDLGRYSGSDDSRRIKLNDFLFEMGW